MAPRTRNRPKKKYMTVQSVTEKLAKKQVLDKLCHDAITAQANSKNNKLPYGYLKSILDKDEFNIKKEDYNWYKVSKRKRRIVENVEISVADQLANEATDGATEPVSASDSHPSQDPTDINDDASVSGTALLGIDEPIGGSQSSTSVTNGVNDPAEVSF